MIKTHLHWEFMVGDATAVTPGVMTIFKNGSFVTVTDKATIEEALAAVKELIPNKQIYHLIRVWECKICIAQEEQVRIQSEYFKRLQKFQGFEKKPWEKKDDTD